MNPKKFYQFKLVSGAGLKLGIALECGLVELVQGVIYETEHRGDVTKMTRGVDGPCELVGVVYKDDAGNIYDEDGNLVQNFEG